MNELQFRQSEAVGEFQLIILAVVSLLLVAVYIYLKFVYVKSHEVHEGVRVLSKTRLSQQSVVYELCTDDKKYVVLESKFGVIELHGETLIKEVEQIG
ncbi:hypothetical protein PSECIP111951_00326 [Pseudoalteromonas holothuriae]|uniref:Uncharacterized protein n=1 Tax=Pseudoalteromonas holothuriae TaxID=2963714 RepID=A0A9W4R150_9GAMM|nr:MULTISPECIES: hypothetical protein [unclassified Pseudoalteromonas]CAH9051091.1 hypothetical protein PSECIP111951_00326 [Pseudoalteromonas sp. CIP111951]CAH9061749.1 hypothetical protein PSECIP111854_02874 [Pseudoalteromonas sp. CIP111854]